MRDYETLADTEMALTESRTFEHAGFEFHVRLAADRRSYRLWVFEGETLVDDVAGLSVGVATQPSDALAEAYLAGSLLARGGGSRDAA